LAKSLATALDLKDDSHYGTLMIGAAELRRLIRAAENRVSAASERGDLTSCIGCCW